MSEPQTELYRLIVAIMVALFGGGALGTIIGKYLDSRAGVRGEFWRRIELLEKRDETKNAQIITLTQAVADEKVECERKIHQLQQQLQGFKELRDLFATSQELTETLGEGVAARYKQDRELRNKMHDKIRRQVIEEERQRAAELAAQSALEQPATDAAPTEPGPDEWTEM